MLANMKMRLALLFAPMALGALAVGLTGMRALSATVEAEEATYSEITKPIRFLLDMSVDLQRARVNLREVVFAHGAEERDAARRTTTELLQSFEKASGKCQGCHGEDGPATFRQTREDMKAYRDVVERVASLASAGKVDEADALMNGSGKATALKMQESLKKLTDLKLETAKSNFEANSERASTARISIILVWLAAVVVAVAIGFAVARGITAPLKKAAQIAESGDLTARMNLATNDEIGRLAKAFDGLTERLEKKTKETERIAGGDFTVEVEVASDQDALGKAFQAMVGELRKLVCEVRAAFGEVTSGSNEISDASQALSQGATEQASSLEEITASMAEVGSQSKTSSENAEQASALASSARDAAQQGSERMKSMVEAMNDINGSSQQIAKIIKVIDDIAFQTNLLALNAAVEAARAGKHGKGFAVVAEEVRNLASRSAKAARETAELIEASGKKVSNGLSVAQGTSESFATIVGNVVKAADLVGEIAAASKEQAAGIAQISQGLSQIDQVTQRNTASAEETASAAQELTSNAAHIEELFAKFRVGDEGGRARRARRPAANGKRAPAPPRASKAAAAGGEWGNSGGGALAARPADAPAEGSLEPKDVIALDDKEFGRF